MLKWIDDRWHLDGRPIHAGQILQLKAVGGGWVDVRIESSDGGKKLFAVMAMHGWIWYRDDAIDPQFDKLRWPA